MVEAGAVEDISVESIRRIGDEEGVCCWRLTTWEDSNDLHDQANRDLGRVVSVDGPITCELEPGEYS